MITRNLLAGKILARAGDIGRFRSAAAFASYTGTSLAVKLVIARRLAHDDTIGAPPICATPPPCPTLRHLGGDPSAARSRSVTIGSARWTAGRPGSTRHRCQRSEATDRVSELFVDGDGLRRGPAEMLATLLHDAAQVSPTNSNGSNVGRRIPAATEHRR